MCGCVSHSAVPDFWRPWTIAQQAPLSMRFPKQIYYSGQPFPSPGHLPNPGIKPGSPTLQANSSPGKPNEWEDYSNYFGERAGISRNWATAHFLTFNGWPQYCHGGDEYVIQMLMYYNEHIIRLKVYWNSTCPPSWTQLV